MPGANGARSKDGPGPVAAVHRILIASALACALFFALWELAEWRRTGDGIVPAAVALLAAAAIGLYFRSLRRLNAKLTPRGDG